MDQETAYTSGARVFSPGFSGLRVAQYLASAVVFCRSLFVLLPIVLSVLRLTASDCPFGIITLFLDYYVFSVPPTKVWMQIRLDGNSDTGCQSSIRYHLRGRING